MKTFYLAAVCLLVSCMTLSAQGVKISPVPSAPDASAGLDVDFNDKGFLPPRLTTAQRNAIPVPAVGLTIYNIDTDCAEMFFLVGGWKSIGCGCNSFPNAGFSYSPVSPGQGSPVSFSVPLTPGATYAWTFQSGVPATANTNATSVTWSSAGSYIVSLTVTDQLGCASTVTDTVVVTNCPPPGSNSVTFSYTGSPQSWVVPACATSITVTAKGAKGGNSSNSSGANGGLVVATLTVTPGETLAIYVGGTPNNNTGGWNGGGNGGNSGQTGGGGGASDIRRNGNTLNDRILVSGGGGGGGNNCGSGNPGGAGGGLTGAAGASCTGTGMGGGGTQSAGGAGGNYGNCQVGAPGTFGVGGNSSACSGGGGGGGGYYGGGGAEWAGGGGGSSYVTINGSSNITHTQGHGNSNGHGEITITY